MYNFFRVYHHLHYEKFACWKNWNIKT